MDMAANGENNIHNTMYLRETRHPLLRIWMDGFTPLVLDAFVMHIWATPLISCLINGASASSNGTFTTSIVLVAAALTFTVNIYIHPHLPHLHQKLGVCDSPLFRSIWIFASAAAVGRYTGDGGILSFTVVTFIPLLYVRVSFVLPAVSALYATLFFALTAGRSLLVFVRHEDIGPSDGIEVPHDILSIGFHWFVFIFSSVYHPVFMSSHLYTVGTGDEVPGGYFFMKWRYTAIPLAAFRTIVVCLCVFIRETYSYGHLYKFHAAIEFIETLLLYVTITTFTAWVHSQHVYPNTLRNILTTAVVTASCGMIVENIEQTAFLCLLAPAAIASDVQFLTLKNMVKIHNE